jgi:uncharacterized protein YoxC
MSGIKLSQKKTVFERLEDRMIELQEEINNKLANIDQINMKLESLETSLENLKQEIPRSIGQNLLQFSDLIGGKIEDIEDALQNVSGSGGAAPGYSAINSLQNELTEIKVSMKNLQNAVQNIKIQVPSSATTPAPAKPATPAPTTPTPARTLVSPTPAPAKPTPAPSTTPSPSVATPTSGPMTDVFKLLDTIAQKAQSGLSGPQIAGEMEQVRDTIVKIFRWHPALYELATFARRLKKAPAGTAADAATVNLLLEKINEWKNRIAG